MRRQVVVLLGLPGAGKSTLAAWFSERGYAVVDLRARLQAALRALLDVGEDGSVEAWEEPLQRALRQVQPDFGGRLARELVDRREGERRLVVDGVVLPEDWEALVGLEGLVAVWVRRPRSPLRRQVPVHYESFYDQVAHHLVENVADLAYLRRRFEVLYSRLVADAEQG